MPIPSTGDRGEPSAGATLKAVVVGTSDHSHLVALVNEMFLGLVTEVLRMLRGRWLCGKSVVTDAL